MTFVLAAGRCSGKISVPDFSVNCCDPLHHSNHTFPDPWVTILFYLYVNTSTILFLTWTYVLSYTNL